jgi:hypothetical protein
MKAHGRIFLCALAALAAWATGAHAGAYVSSSGDPTAITHPAGYSGTGGVVNLTVCVDPKSTDAELLDLAMPDVLATWNAMTPVSPNLFFGGDNDIPFDGFDWASVALHEMGHCIGLAHPNLASESQLSGLATDATQSTAGSNGVFNISFGADGAVGTADDVRGDDVNRHWFRITNNDPFTIEPVTIDTSTYSVDLGDLPPGDLFAANAGRDVAAELGHGDSECVMQQGQFNDEAQRDLGHDDVATVTLGMAGVDETQGTADDYTISLTYGGISDSGCDIIANLGSAASFAFCSFGLTSIGVGPGSEHDRLLGGNDGLPARLEFNKGVNWHYVLPEQPDLCGAAPAVGCRAAAAAQLQIKDADGTAKDSVNVKLGKADATDYADFLDPTTDTAYSVCIYDSSVDSQPVLESGAGAGGNCSGKPCWKAKDGKGYQFKSKTGILEGVTKVKLKAGPDGKASVAVAAKGSFLDTPAPPLTFPVTVQVVADDGMTTECWEAGFASASTNTPGQLKAKSP